MASIILDQVRVDLPVYDGSRRSLRRTMLSMGVGGMVFRDDRQHLIVRALDGITLSLRDGDRVGLIGHNGAGKSTLLRVLAGIFEPTHGHALVTGKVSSLLNMAAMLDPEMTGYENIDHASVLLGIPTSRRAALCAEIEDFTELGAFLDMPVRTYSAGMQVRLSFALLTSQSPEILLLDEALGAGDAGFVHKAAARVRDRCDRANILVLASHAQDHIRQLCATAVWLEHGRIRQFGPVDDVLAAYGKSTRPALPLPVEA